MASGFGVNLKAGLFFASNVVGKTVKGLREGSGVLLLQRSRLLEFRRDICEDSCDIAKMDKQLWWKETESMPNKPALQKGRVDEWS